jgi:citrate synthase
VADLIEVPSGLEGVIAFDTAIAEPDKEGGALRYRGVDIEELVGRVRFEKVWGLLVDGSFEPGMPPAEPHPLAVRSGDPRHVKAIDAYWISAAEHGMNASTFTARVVASTGADVAAALSARSTAVPRAACCTCSTRSRRPATPNAGSSRRSTRASA